MEPVTLPQIKKHLDFIERGKGNDDDDKSKLMNIAAILLETHEVKNKSSNYHIKVKRLLGRRIQYMEELIDQYVQLGLTDKGEEDEDLVAKIVEEKRHRPPAKKPEDDIAFVSLNFENLDQQHNVANI